MGNGNVEGGKKFPIRKPSQPMAGTLPGKGSSAAQFDAQKIERPRVCGAMTQQCGDSGHYSAPQKLLQLVGCREPKARPEPKLRPKPNPVQR